jgi:phosphatidate cytidylyltransferase
MMTSEVRLAKRALVTIILLPIVIAAIIMGSWVYVAMVILILGLAASEYVRLFRASGLQPAGFLVVIAVLLFTVGRALNGFESAAWISSLVILALMTYHLVVYERGRDLAATDFSASLSGAFYIGWLGAYMVSLRALPSGMWWVLLVLPGIWLADTGAYLIGSRFGRHKLSPRLSPKKSWEGYLAGIVTGVLGTIILALIWKGLAGSELPVTWPQAGVLGFILGAVPTLGDLGESMIKRQVGAKDSGNLLPGHGGAFDRIDSWLWAGVLGYYVIVWFFMG